MFWVKIILLIVATLIALLYSIYHFWAAITRLRLGRILKRARERGEQWILLTHESYETGRKGDYHKSIELAEKAIELNPRASEAWRLIGNAYELLGDQMEENSNYEQTVEYHKRATEAWKRAKEIDPKIIIPFYHR
ncbi:MAG: tetratricopeptide repeat protein [Sedimentisphaerales bacterium]